MAQKSFYVDACIWLNLFKKEGDPTKGIPYWKIAEDFIETIMFSQDKEIIYSGFVLKELKYKLEESVFKEKVLFFKEEEKIKFVKADEEDYSFARKLESELSYELSFFDCLHIALCKRLNLILITRDDILIQFAKKHIEVQKPEDLLS
jgi:predicted nucleic acid-binding protein